MLTVRFELTTFPFGGEHSIRLSYASVKTILNYFGWIVTDFILI